MMLQSSKSKQLFLQIASDSASSCSHNLCIAAAAVALRKVTCATGFPKQVSISTWQGTSIGGSDHIWHITKHVIDNVDSDTIYDTRYHMTPIILWEDKSAELNMGNSRSFNSHLTLLSAHSELFWMYFDIQNTTRPSVPAQCLSALAASAAKCFHLHVSACQIRVSTGTSQFLLFTGVPWGPYTFTGHHTCLSSIFAYVRVLVVEVEAIPTWGLSFIHLKTACRNEISREWIIWRKDYIASASASFRNKNHIKKEPSAGFRDCSPACPQLRWQLTKDEVTVVPPDSCAMQRVPCKYCPKDSDLSKNHDLPTYLCERLQIK